MKNLNFQVSEAIYQRLKRMAREFEITPAQVAKELVEGGAESADELIRAGGIQSSLNQPHLVAIQENAFNDAQEGIPMYPHGRHVQ